MKVKFTLQTFGDNSLGYETHFPVPNEIAEKFIDGKDRRIIVDHGYDKPHHCALNHDGLGGYYILLNKEIRKKAGYELGKEYAINIVKDKSKYGMYCPPSFEELLNQDPEGEAYFESLTPGAKRSLLHIVGKLKSEAKQIEKGFILLEYLKEVQGKLDFKELQQAFKERKFL